MKTLHQIQIVSPISKKYKATITLMQQGEVFMLKILTEYEGNKWRCYDYYEKYEKALKDYIERVAEYAEHTAYMNF